MLNLARKSGVREDGPRETNLHATSVLTASLLALYLVFHSWDAWDREKSRTLESLQITAEVEGRALNQFFENQEVALRSLSEDLLDNQGSLKSTSNIATLLQKKIEKENDWTAIQVSNLDGKTLASSQGDRLQLPARSAPASADWVASVNELRSGKRMSIGRAVFGRLTGQWVVPLRVGLRDGAGNLTHVLSASLPLSRPVSFWEGVQFPHSGGVSIYLVRNEVFLIGRYPIPNSSEALEIFGKARTGDFANRILNKQLPDSGTFEGLSTLSQTPSLWGYARSKDFPVFFGIQSPKSLIWKNWAAQVLPTYFVISVLLLIASLTVRAIRQREAKQIQVSLAAERKLKASEERLAIAAKGTLDGIWDWNVQNDEAYLSPRWKEILGFGEQELHETVVGTFFNRLHPDDREAIAMAVHLHLEQNAPYNVEVRLLHKDGNYRWIHARGNAVRSADGKPLRMVGSITDITERRQKDQQQQLLAQIVNDSADAIISRDLDGKISTWNPAAEKLLGYSAAEALGTDIALLVPPDCADEVKAMRAKMKAGAPNVRYESVRLAKDGSRIPVSITLSPVRDQSGNTISLSATLRDLRERLRAEQALNASNARLSLAIDIANLGVFESDFEKGTVYWSEPLRAMYGIYPGQAIASGDFLKSVHPDDFDRVSAERKRAASPLSDGLFSSEFRVVRRDGELAWIQARAQNFFAGQGEDAMRVRSIGVHLDVTPQRRAQETLKSLLAEKDTLLKEIYHRVKNNLQVVSSLLHLQGRGVTDTVARRMLDDSASRVKSMALVHEQLYRSNDLSRISLGQYLRELTTHLAQMNRPKSNQVRLELDVEEIFVGIETAIPLGLAANELISNAYKHAYPDASQGGRVIVRARNLQSGMARLEVEDDGRGLREDFSPGTSTSLGMQLVTTLARQLGAELEIDRTRGQGARFVLRFGTELVVQEKVAA